MWPSFRHSPEQALTFLGEQPLGLYGLPHDPQVVWVTEPTSVLQILSNLSGKFRKNMVPPNLRWMLGDGTAASDYGSESLSWESLRSAKKTATLPFMMPLQVQRIKLKEVSISTNKEKGAIDVYSWCHDLLFTLAWEHTFGCRLSEEVTQANKALCNTSKAVYEALRETTYFDRRLVDEQEGQESFNPVLERRQDAITFLLNELANNYRSRCFATAFGNFFGERKSQISPERAQKFALVGLLMASYENAASTAAWALWLLAKHPSEQDNVASSLKFGDSTLLDRTINETLRLYPPVWSMARQADSSCELGGQNYKAGTWFFISPWVQGRFHDAWESSLDFLPQRWLQNETAAAFFLPFGSGSRRCPGEALARSQLKICLGELLSKWTFEIAEGHPAPVPLFGLTQRPEDGVWLRVLPRL